MTIFPSEDWQSCQDMLIGLMEKQNVVNPEAQIGWLMHVANMNSMNSKWHVYDNELTGYTCITICAVASFMALRLEAESIGSSETIIANVRVELHAWYAQNRYTADVHVFRSEDARQLWCEENAGWFVERPTPGELEKRGGEYVQH